MLILKMPIKLRLESAHAYKHSDIYVKTNKDNMVSVFCIHKITRNPLWKYIQYIFELLMCIWVLSFHCSWVYLYFIKIVPFWLRNIRFLIHNRAVFRTATGTAGSYVTGTASRKNGCQIFSYVHRSRKHWKCKYLSINTLHSGPWPNAMTSVIDQLLHEFKTLLLDWTLLPILSFYQIPRGFIEHLQQAWLSNREC